jgi:hypothetical protein
MIALLYDAALFKHGDLGGVSEMKRKKLQTANVVNPNYLYSYIYIPL